MRITPSVGTDGEQPAEQSDGSARSGVRARVRAGVRWLVRRLRSIRSSNLSPSAQTDRRLDQLPTTRDEQRSAALPATRLTMPNEDSEVETERAGDRFRVYDPDNHEAYVSSDEWVSIER